MDSSFYLRFLSALRQRLLVQLPVADSLLLLPAYLSLPHVASDSNGDGEIRTVRGFLNRARCLEVDLKSGVHLYDAKCVAPHEGERILRAGLNSILNSAKALLHLYGVRNLSDGMIYRELGRLVVKNTFPRGWSAYAAGHYGAFNTHRLGFGESPAEFERHAATNKTIDQGLRLARSAKALAVKEALQAFDNTALRGLNGHRLVRFQAHHWQQITWRLGYTTLFDVLREVVEELPQVEGLDGEQEQQAAQDLADIATHFNDLMEQYMVKALGECVLHDPARPMVPIRSNPLTLASAA